MRAPWTHGLGECRKVRARFVDRLTGDLSAADEERDDAHLVECPDCRRAWQQVVEAWRSLPENGEAEPPVHARAAVLAGAREALAQGPGAANLEAEARHGKAVRHPRRRRVARVLPWAGLAVVLTGASIALLAVRSEPRPLEPGRSMPELNATVVTTGAPASLSAYRGSVVVLNVWATWCIPCESEMASLERLEQRLWAEGLRVVAVSVDRESRHRVRTWAEERGLDLTLLHDPTGSVERRIQLVGVPETFIIGPDGVLLWRDYGPRDWSAPAQVELVRGFMRGRSSS